MMIFGKIAGLVTKVARWPRSHGFGVQSPSAYEMIVKVIGDYGWHDEYGSVEQHHVVETNYGKRLGRLVFRLVRYLQTELFVATDNCCAAYAVYATVAYAGCEPYIINEDIPQLPHGRKLLIVADVGTDAFCRLAECVLGGADADTVMLVDGIRRNKESLQRWERMVADSRSGVAMDMYSCGLVFFDMKKYKRNYKIYFRHKPLML